MALKKVWKYFRFQSPLPPVKYVISTLYFEAFVNRDMYKDFVWLHRDGRLIPHDLLKFDNETNDKGEPTTQSKLCEGERLIPGTGLLTGSLKKGLRRSTITFCISCLKYSGRGYKEERDYVKENMLARFYFLTKCWSDHLKEFLLRVKKEDGDPDLILILSCLWDTNRWSSDNPSGLTSLTYSC